jgi:hypothetical protein
MRVRVRRSNRRQTRTGSRDSSSRRRQTPTPSSRRPRAACAVPCGRRSRANENVIDLLDRRPPDAGRVSREGGWLALMVGDSCQDGVAAARAASPADGEGARRDRCPQTPSSPPRDLSPAGAPGRDRQRGPGLLVRDSSVGDVRDLFGPGASHASLKVGAGIAAAGVRGTRTKRPPRSSLPVAVTFRSPHANRSAESSILRPSDGPG